MRHLLGLGPACADFHSAEIDALIGVLRAYLGDTEEALRRLRAAIAKLSELDRHLAGFWTVQLAETKRDIARDSFLVTLERGMPLLDPRRDPDIHQIAAINLATALTQEGRPLEGMRIINEVEFTNRFFAAKGKVVKAFGKKSVGELKTACDWITDAINEYMLLERSNDSAACFLLRGEIQLERVLIQSSLKDFAAALEIYETLDFSSFMIGAVLELQGAVRDGNAPEAARIAKRIRRQLTLPPNEVEDV